MPWDEHNPQLYISRLLPGDAMRRVCARTGAGVELLQFSVAGALDALPDAIARARDALAGYPAGTRVTLHGPFLDMNPAAWDSMIRRASMARFGQAYDAALALGADKLVLHTGFYPNANYIQGWAERAADFFAEFLRVRSGVRVVLENLFDPLPEPVLEVVNRVDRDDFRLCLDIGHAHCYSRLPVTAWAERLLPALDHVHIHDNHGFRGDGGSPDEHLALGQGSIPLEDVFAILRAKPDLTYTIECSSERAVLASWESWRRMTRQG